MAYIAIFFNMFSGIVYTPWMIRYIGQSEFALYSLALTLIGFFTMDFGLGEAVSRFLSKYKAENNNSKAKDFLGITLKIYIIIDLLIFLVLLVAFIFAEVIYAQLTPTELSKFRLVFSVAAIYCIASFPFIPLNSILISNERFAFQKFADLLNKMLTVATMAVVLTLGYRLYSLVIVNAITGLITIGFKLRYSYKNKLIEINFKSRDKVLLKAIFSFSIWISVIAVAQRFIINVTPTVLAIFAGSIQISLFSIAMLIEGYTWTFANALNGIFLPKVTRIVIKKDRTNEIENLMIRVGRIQLVLVGLLLVGFMTMGKEFITLWMGNNFLDSYYVTLLLIAPGFITLTQQIGNTALVAINKIKYGAFCYLIVAGISLTLSVLFTQYWGAVGAGIAIFIGNIIGQIIVMNLVYYKVLKINIFRFFRECHVKMFMPLILTSGIGVLMQHAFPTKNLILFMTKVCILGAVYLLFMLALVLINSKRTNLRKH